MVGPTTLMLLEAFEGLGGAGGSVVVDKERANKVITLG